MPFHDGIYYETPEDLIDFTARELQHLRPAVAEYVRQNALHVNPDNGTTRIRAQVWIDATKQE